MDATSPDPPEPAKPPVSVPAERRFAMRVAAAVALLTLLPYLAGWLRCGAGSTGLLYDSAQDGCVYLSWMRQAAEGHFFLGNRFVTDPQSPHFTHLLFWAMGRVAGILGGSPAAHLLVYHGVRVLLIFALFAALAGLLAHILPDRREQRLAMLLVAFSGGEGWLAALAGAPAQWQGLDLGGWLASGARRPVMPEANTFLSMLHYPHFVAAPALMLFCLERCVAPRRQPDPLLALGAFLLAHIHAYDAATVPAALAVWVLLSAALQRRLPEWRALAPAATFLAGALPALLYQGWVVRTDPLWAAKAAVALHSPPLAVWLVTLGLLLPAAALGAGAAWRSGGAALLLPAWAVTFALLGAAPVSFQRKLTEGVHLPLAILAAVGICRIAARARQPWLPVAFLLLAALSPLATLVDAVADRAPAEPWRIYPPIVLPNEERAALAWLAGHAQPGDGVFSWRGLALYVPVRTQCSSYAGHWGETPQFGVRLSKVRAFYAPNTPPEERTRILSEARARFVYFGRAERALGGALWQPDADPRLRRVFTTGESAVYEVVP